MTEYSILIEEKGRERDRERVGEGRTRDMLGSRENISYNISHVLSFSLSILLSNRNCCKIP